MGPRRWSRGRVGADRRLVRIARRLQWGHGDGAVEEAATQTRCAATWRLQWGHGDGAVEEGQRARWNDCKFTASMGPRRWSRGRVGASAKPALVSSASMGPRRWSRGRGKADQLGDKLAFGFNGATAMEPWKRA